jgi:hypothetical protein
MTIAVAEALMTAADQGVMNYEPAVKELLIDSMQKWGHRYPYAGYGGRFRGWLAARNPKPYNSWGNG